MTLLFVLLNVVLTLYSIVGIFLGVSMYRDFEFSDMGRLRRALWSIAVAVFWLPAAIVGWCKGL